ncbi:MAG TPA: hypothetical protein VFT29_08245 [Gemmatimonadaceae bacterium]|nr:hypothetical protein [Gemmatimonadaceae bacterium]
MRCSGRAVAAVLSLVVAVSPLRAQENGLAIRAARRDPIAARSAFTAAFTVTSRRADTVRMMPHIELPAQWSILTGSAPFDVAPHAAEILMLSVAVPARAAAGDYPVRVWVTTPLDPKGLMDSVIVTVPVRRILDFGLIDKPGYVVAGSAYETRFLLRNRGNLGARVKVTARSTLGAAVVSDTTITLGPDESRVVRATVQTPVRLDAAEDDILELAATQMGDTLASPAQASARVTVVPEPDRKIEEYLRVPTQLRLRAASSDGVSPFVLFGRGAMRDGGSTQIDFLARGPTGEFSAFGERDEYRLQLSAPSWRVRLGDQLHQASTLTGLAQPGFGASADAGFGPVSLGAFGQRFRYLPEKGDETGGFLSARPIADTRLAVNFVNRAGGLLPGQVGSASAAVRRPAYSAELEVARSHSARGAGGLARSARLSGGTARASYDIGHVFADTSFAGVQRGSEHDYLTATTRVDVVSFGLSASTHRTDLTRTTGVPYGERFDLGTISATWKERLTLELGAVRRASTVQGARVDGRQRDARLRGDQELTFGTMSLELEGGRATSSDTLGSSRAFSDISLALRRGFEFGGASLWADRYSGGSVTKGSEPSVTVGGDVSMRVAATTEATLLAFATRLQNLTGEWHSQLDAQVVHTLPNGNTVGLRARLIGGGSLPRADQSVAYLEYGVPLRLPVSRLRTPGRVRGKVVDATTGRGVSGALVRLGPQAAITDRDGRVVFGGVPGGEHRLSMSQETSFADAVFVGDPTLRVDSARAEPTTFELAIARGARVNVSVRRFNALRTTVGGPPDSLVEAGAVANATLVLAGQRDTLFRTTNDKGVATFTDIPPGTWAVAVRGDAPVFTRFDPDRVEVTLAPGETKSIAFRLVPRKREVQLIGEGEELRPSVPQPKAAVQQSVKTGKPNDRPDDKNRP